MSEQQYLNLLQDILNNGAKKSIFAENGKTLPTIDRNTYYEVDKDSKYLSSVVGRILRFDLTENKIPLLTTKAVYYPGAFKEMLWFLKGKGNVALLHQQGFPGWNGWAYKKYLKSNPSPRLSYEDFVQEYLSPAGAEYFVEVPYTDMTGWKYPVFQQMDRGDEEVEVLVGWEELDQTKWLIDSIKKNPDRKSYVINAWNPTRLYAMAEICGNESVALAACHCEHQVVINDGKVNLRVTIRSSDTPLGLPFNIAQYGLLAHMYAKCIGLPAGELIIMITDAHIYSDQVDMIQEQLTKEYGESPTLVIKDRGQQYLTDFEYSDFKVKGYFPEESLRMPLTIVGGF